MENERGRLSQGMALGTLRDCARNCSTTICFSTHLARLPPRTTNSTELSVIYFRDLPRHLWHRKVENAGIKVLLLGRSGQELADVMSWAADGKRERGNVGVLYSSLGERVGEGGSARTAVRLCAVADVLLVHGIR